MTIGRLTFLVISHWVLRTSTEISEEYTRMALCAIPCMIKANSALYVDRTVAKNRSAITPRCASSAVQKIVFLLACL